MGWERVGLADAMITLMTRDEVEDLCFRLQVDDETLDSRTKSSLVRSLIKYMEQRRQLDLLTRELAAMRPDIQPQTPAAQPRVEVVAPPPTHPPATPVLGERITDADRVTRGSKVAEPQPDDAQGIRFKPWILAAFLLLAGGSLWWLASRLGQPSSGPSTALTAPPSRSTSVPTAAQAGIPQPTQSLTRPIQSQSSPSKTISPVTTNAQWTPQFQSFDGVEMALVPPGCFMMGTPNPLPRRQDEKSTTRVCVPKPFWIDKTEVTQAQFRRLGGKAANPVSFVGDNRPVESIKWDEARDFCTLRGARLPSEAEWEYAARGPDNLVYPWGNDFDDSKVVYFRNSGGQTSDVGSRPAGASWVGALDIIGNVWEWVSSTYTSSPFEAMDVRESLDDDKGARVLRGGSWYFNLAYALQPPYGNDLGFRCARSA